MSCSILTLYYVQSVTSKYFDLRKYDIKNKQKRKYSILLSKKKQVREQHI